MSVSDREGADRRHKAPPGQSPAPRRHLARRAGGNQTAEGTSSMVPSPEQALLRPNLTEIRRKKGSESLRAFQTLL